jgi:tetratricopeptide (TPR) repeat protein
MSGAFSLFLVLGLACLAGAATQTQDQTARIATLQEVAKLIEAGDLGDAEAALKPLTDKSPADPIALNLLGVVRVQEDRKGQAEDLFHRAIAAGPYLPGPHINLARLYGKERAEDAMAELGKALEIAPADDDAVALLRDIARSAASEAARSGDNERAVAILLAAHKVAPHDADLLVDTALAAMDNGLWADGEKYLVQALSIRPDFPRATYALARAYLGQSKNQPAEEQMRKYLAAKPDDATAQYGLGFILTAEQKTDEARAAFEKSIALQPQQTESFFQLGEIAVQQGKRDEAKEDFQKVLERDPRHAGALTETGILEFRAGNLAEARSTLQQATTLAPSYYKAHYYYALTLKKLGDAEAAEREFRIATDLQKHDTPTARLAPDRQ